MLHTCFTVAERLSVVHLTWPQKIPKMKLYIFAIVLIGAALANANMEAEEKADDAAGFFEGVGNGIKNAANSIGSALGIGRAADSETEDRSGCGGGGDRCGGEGEERSACGGGGDRCGGDGNSSK